jgi:prevent-host-death family protein
MGGMAEEIPVTQARAGFADLVNRVVYGRERIVVTRHGRAIAALVSADDLARLEAFEQGEAGTTVVRLGGGPVVQQPPVAPGQPSPARYDIAARHRPPDAG